MSVVVVTYNSDRHIERLLLSLDDGLSGVERWELVIVDNASVDGTVELIRRSSEAMIVEMPCNVGYAAAINAGMTASSLDGHLLVLNPDVELRRGCVAALLAALEGGGAGLAVPRLVGLDGSTRLSLRRDPSIKSAWSNALLGGRLAGRLGWSDVIANPDLYESDCSIDWASGAVIAVSRECLAVVGPWDESYFLYSEEVDYFRRARAAGFSAQYVHGAAAVHAEGAYTANPTLWSLLVRNRVVDFDRSHPVPAAMAHRAGVAAGELLRSPLRPSHRRGLLAAALARDPRPRSAMRARQSARQRGDGFIWFAAVDWWYHNRAHSDFQLMRHVARDQPVLVVNSLGLRLPRRGVSANPGRRIARKLRSIGKFVRRPVPDLPQFHVMTPIMVPAYGGGWLARVNAAAIQAQVSLVARILGIRAAPTIGVTIPTAWPVVAKMDRSCLVFNRSDLQSSFPEADGQRIADLERQLLRHSDAVLYVSHELMKFDADVVGDRAYFLDHGVDLDHFNSAVTDIDPSVAAIPRPRVGFFGGFDDYVVDIGLLAATARALPDVNLVLIGDATCSMDQLTALPNVYWFEYQPYERIPAMGRGFDVALMPWLDNEWIRFANPIKLKEYLALGLPVVSTDYPEVAYYRDRVLVAESREDFPIMVRRALSTRVDPTALRCSVMPFSWETRAAALTSLCAGRSIR